MKTKTLSTAVLSILTASGLHAATFIVTNSNNSGAGSLRQAIMDANATPAADTIQFDTLGHFSVPRTITLTSDEIAINSPLTITGPASPLRRVSISGNNASQVLLVSGVGAEEVTLQHLTVRDGASTFGGGIRLSGTSTTLTVTDCTIRDCAGVLGSAGNAANGGGIAVTSGSLFLSNSTLSVNTCAGYGGGLSVSGGSAVITNSSFLNNSSGGFLGGNAGGGMDASGDSIIEITDSTFSGNHSSDGGGLRVFGPDATLTRCEFSANTAFKGAGLMIIGGGECAVRDCTLSGNDALSIGGGLFSSTGLHTVTNCTFSANTAGTTGGGIHVGGGGITTVLNCTITKNSAPTGGGVFVDSLFIVGNSIIAENTTLSAFDVSSSTIFHVGNVGHNLIGVETSGSFPNFVNGTNGDLVGTTAAPLLPVLGPLQDNGGQTFTHAPLFGSPAIEAGDSSFVAEPDFVGPNFTDQRGEPRISVENVDIGSYEYPALEVTNTNNSGPGSLRELLAQAQALGGGVIAFNESTFASARQTITLTSGQLISAVDTTIIAPEVGLKISGGNSSRVFRFSGGSSTLRRVVVADGLSTVSGGGIRVTGAATSVLLNDVSMLRCSALNGGGLDIDAGSVTATRCAIISNEATSGDGGGIRVTSGGMLNLTNSTVSDNEATGDGGGIAHESGQTRLINCTVNENRADSDADGLGNGGGISRVSGQVGLGNTIVSSNRDNSVSPAEKFQELAGSFTSLGHNLVARTDGSTGIVNGTMGDLAGVVGAALDPLLSGAPGDPVFVPDSTSLAVNTGDPALLDDAAWPTYPTFDQRGQYRVFQGVVDIGAAENPIGAVVKITVPNAAASEHGPQLRKFQIRRSFHASQLIVDLTIDPASTASAGDYVFSGSSYVSTGPSSLSVTFPAGVDYIQLTATPVDDALVEGTETLGLMLGGSGYRIDPDDSNAATMSILDDEFTVTSAASSGSSTLRRAIIEANAAGGGVITIPSPLDITLTGNALVIDGDIQIIGNVSTVSASGLSRVFTINGDGGGCVKLQGLVITGGFASVADGAKGGGILIDSACVEIRGSAIHGNTEEGDGGGIHQSGNGVDFTIINSAVHSNSTFGTGGGLFTASSSSDISITNVTFARNEAFDDGGGMLLALINPVSSAITNCTFTENIADSDATGFGNGGGLYWTTGQLALGNTVISGNFDTPGNAGPGTIQRDAVTLTGSLIGNGGNFIGDNSGFSSIIAAGAPNLGGDYAGTLAAPLDAKLLAQEEPRLFYVFPPDSLLACWPSTG